MLASIIIPCHGERPFTELCVDSVRANAADVPWELVLVDNGSPDDTASWGERLARDDGRIRVVRLGRNTGFARGVNAGLAVARGSHLVVLNNDAVVTAAWLDRMVAVLDEEPDVGIVGPMCNYVAGPQRVRAVPYDDDLDLMHEFAAGWRRDHAGERLSVPRIVGFCMVMRRAVVDAIGGFDPVYGSGNFEDDDFCLRAQVAGFELRIACDVFLHHFGSRTFVALGRQEDDGTEGSYRRSIKAGWDRFIAKWGFDPDVPFKDPARVRKLVFDPTAARVPLAAPGLFRVQVAEMGWESALIDYATGQSPDSPALLYVEAGPDGLAEAQRRALAALERAGLDPATVPDIDIVPKAPDVGADIMTWKAVPKGGALRGVWR